MKKFLNHLSWIWKFSAEYRGIRKKCDTFLMLLESSPSG